MLGFELFGVEEGGIQLGISLNFGVFLGERVPSIHEELDARGDQADRELAVIGEARIRRFCGIAAVGRDHAYKQQALLFDPELF